MVQLDYWRVKKRVRKKSPSTPSRCAGLEGAPGREQSSGQAGPLMLSGRAKARPSLCWSSSAPQGRVRRHGLSGTSCDKALRLILQEFDDLACSSRWIKQVGFLER